MDELQTLVADGTSGYVVLPLAPWRRALNAAKPTDEEQTQIVSDLKSGAMAAGNVDEVGVKRAQAKMVLEIQPKPAKESGDSTDGE